MSVCVCASGMRADISMFSGTCIVCPPVHVGSVCTRDLEKVVTCVHCEGCTPCLHTFTG